MIPLFERHFTDRARLTDRLMVACFGSEFTHFSFFCRVSWPLAQYLLVVGFVGVCEAIFISEFESKLVEEVT